MNFELSQVFVIFGAICLATSFNLKNETKKLIFLLLFFAFFATQYFLLGALTGGVLECVLLVQVVLTFLLKKKDNFKLNILLVIVFNAIFILSTYFTYVSWVCIVPLVGVLLTSTFALIKNPILDNFTYALQCVGFGCYAYAVGSYTAFGIEIIAFILTIISIAIDFIKMKKAKCTNSIENNNELKVIEKSNIESSKKNK